MSSRFKFGLLISSVVLLTGFTHSFSSLSMEQIMQLVNADRTQSGLPALNLNSTLNLAAYAHAEDMLSHHYFAHTSPSGVDPWYWMSELGYNYSFAGENLAIGYSNAQELVNSWMGSTDHRANILSPNFSEVGLAVIKGSDSTLVVQMFGAPHQLTIK